MHKPFKTYRELINLMESRGLKTNGTTKFILEREGYYAVVNGYKDPFLDVRLTRSFGDDRFIRGSTFDEIYALFVMDRQLRSTLFRYITLTEATLKSICVYQFTAKYRHSPDAYLEASSYRDDRNYPELVAAYIKELVRIVGMDPNKPPKFMRPYLKHYKNKYGTVPLWVLMNTLGLGQAFKFFDFQKESLRLEISKRFQALYNETHTDRNRITPKKLRLIYDHIKSFRNICAHDERLYCAKVDKSQSTWFSDVVKDLSLVLTATQFNSLVDDILLRIESALTKIHTVGEYEIVSRMGFESAPELKALATK